jgi:hypothetical protein
MKLKQLLVNRLVIEAGQNAEKSMLYEASKQKLSDLAIAEDHIRTRDEVIETQKKKIEDMVRESNRMERALNNLADAAMPALQKLRIGSAPRLALSKAIGEAKPFYDPPF